MFLVSIVFGSFSSDADSTCYLAVLRVSNLPDLKTMRGEERKFYVIIRDTREKWKDERKTKPIRKTGQAVEWNEDLDGLYDNFLPIAWSNSHLIAVRYIHLHKLL